MDSATDVFSWILFTKLSNSYNIANVWLVSRSESVFSTSEMQSVMEKVKNEIKLEQKNNITLAAAEAKTFAKICCHPKHSFYLNVFWCGLYFQMFTSQWLLMTQHLTLVKEGFTLWISSCFCWQYISLLMIFNEIEYSAVALLYLFSLYWAFQGL